MDQHQQMKTKTTPRHLKRGDNDNKTGGSGGVGFDYHYDDEDEFNLKKSFEAIQAHIRIVVVFLVLLMLICYFCCGCCRGLSDRRRERFGYMPV
jgi:hypothetical protein